MARELKRIDPDIELIAICEKGSQFVGLYTSEQSIAKVYQVRAGKYRRYAGIAWYQRVFDVRTFVLNVRDMWRTLVGYVEARKLLKKLRPDALLIKGGYVAVPVGLAAAGMDIPFLTHDSDSTPGLANRIIGRWARLHATALPTELYSYPQQKTIFTGIPVADRFVKVTKELKTTYRQQLGLSGCSHVITIVGGSQGAAQLNRDVTEVVPQLLGDFPHLGIVHIAGKSHELEIRNVYEKLLSPTQLDHIIVQGFVDTVEQSQGAADVVVSRAGATQMAELAIQGLPVIIVPGKLAGGHQDKNADFFAKQQAAQVVPFGDANQLYHMLKEVLSSDTTRSLLSKQLHILAKPSAAAELARATLSIVGERA